MMRWVQSLGVGCVLAVAVALPADAAPVGSVRLFSLPNANSVPNAIAAGPDGNLWFTEFNGSRIGRITPDGVVTEFPTLVASSAPLGITTGPDGNLWFTAAGSAANGIGRITPSGAITMFPLPNPGSWPYEIVTGPDGNLWFTELDGNRIGRITTAGVITEFTAGISPAAKPADIVAGPDGNLWFTEIATASKIGRITTAGVVTEFPTPTADSYPIAMTVGPDGALWFVEKRFAKLGRITTAGVTSELANGAPANGIAIGPDGNFWLAVQNAEIARITLAGVRTMFLTGAPSVLIDIVKGPDDAMWFTSNVGNLIGRMTAVDTPTPTPAPCTARVTGVTPASAPAGAEVTISGTGFGCATGVRFGDAPAAGFAIGGFDRITARVPEHAPGDVDVRVLTAAGASPVVAAGRFTFTAGLDVLAAPELAAPLAAARRVTCMRVPTLTGATLARARRILARDGCAVGLTVTGKRPRRGHRRVTAQTPRPGTPLYEGDRAPAVRFA
jgi:streptogramin lyase